MTLSRLFSAFLCLATSAALRADPFTFAASGIDSSSQITLPAGMTTVVEAVNVASTSPSTVNGLTFAADNGNASGSFVTFAGNGYTAKADTEGGSSISGASFTSSTVNILSTGVFTGNSTSLTPNTDYVFQLYLSDNNGGRGGQFDYTLDGTTATQYVTQNLGTLNLYQVSFNSGSATTFGWDLTAISGYHDSKVAGFALYSGASAIPEPSTYAIIAGAACLALAAYRRR